MSKIIKSSNLGSVIDKKQLITRLLQIIECDDSEVIKIALQALIDEIEDYS